MIVAIRIERRTPPRIPLTIKKIAIAPIRLTITVGLLSNQTLVADDEAALTPRPRSAPLPATVKID